MKESKCENKFKKGEEVKILSISAGLNGKHKIKVGDVYLVHKVVFKQHVTLDIQDRRNIVWKACRLKPLHNSKYLKS